LAETGARKRELKEGKKKTGVSLLLRARETGNGSLDALLESLWNGS